MSNERGARRKGFDHETRIALLEDDLDRMESSVAEGLDRLSDRIDNAVREMDGLRKVLVGLLVAISSGAVVAAVNIAVNIGR